MFGLLGPNGAGKTSTVEILEGLRPPDGGRVSVCGLDPQTSGDAFKQEIGAVLQSTALPDKIRVNEALTMFASFYDRHRETGRPAQALRARREAQRLLFPALRRAKAAAGAGDVPGQRAAACCSSTSRPPDSIPQVRREIYDIIEELKTGEENDPADHALHRGSRTAVRPRGDRRPGPRDRPRHAARAEAAARPAPRASNCAWRARNPRQRWGSSEGVADCLASDGLYMMHSTRVPQTIVSLVKYLEAQGNELAGLEIAAPSLEDVFLELTGRRLRD